VAGSTARRDSFAFASKQAGRAGLAACVLILGCESLQNAVAEGDTRTISLHHIHTKEDLTITYKRNGRYDAAALEKINWHLRDWRKQQQTSQDPKVIDILWEVQREVGATSPIHIVCGYRSPDTNAMLRRRSRGVAQHSQHTLGKAIDFYIPGVPIEKLRNAGLQMQRGGVGYYPSSGVAFVHLDIGSVRHWPRIPEPQMARIMAGARTAVARADTAEQPKSFFSKLFGSNEPTEQAPVADPKRNAGAPTFARSPAATAEPASAKLAASVPVPAAKATVKTTSFQLASAPAPAVDEPASGLTTEALMASSTRRQRGVETASADPSATGAVTRWPLADEQRGKDRVPSELLLAYAPQSESEPVKRAAPMGNAAQRAPIPASQVGSSTIIPKQSGSLTRIATPVAAPPEASRAAPAKVGQAFNDPWLRAMMTAPSAQSHMTTSMLGDPDYRTLRPLLQKPVASVVMTFSEDPYLGMQTERFTGAAIAFVPTVSFTFRTASLR
jgi:uncharacterized protein YcbK (DUF882 family)